MAEEPNSTDFGQEQALPEEEKVNYGPPEQEVPLGFGAPDIQSQLPPSIPGQAPPGLPGMMPAAQAAPSIPGMEGQSQAPAGIPSMPAGAADAPSLPSMGPAGLAEQQPVAYDYQDPSSTQEATTEQVPAGQGQPGSEAHDAMAFSAPEPELTQFDRELANRAELAKGKLFDEIAALNDQSIVVGDQSMSEDFDDRVLAFTVTEPTITQGVTRYAVKGELEDGIFETQRRYQEFEALRTALVDRWPGVYVPMMPAKAGVTQKNTDPAFLEERRSLLERFLRELAQFKFIINSAEFLIFARGVGEVLNEFKGLAPMTPKDILERYRANFNIEEEQDQSIVNQYKDEISEFSAFLRKAVVRLERAKANLKGYVKNSETSMAQYKGLYKSLTKFEDEVIDFLADGDRLKRTITGPAAYDQDLQVTIEDKTSAWKNAFRDPYIWVKGELLDTLGMIDALNGRDKQISVQQKMEDSRRSKQTELEKLTLGKSTMKSFFKSKSGKEKDMLNYQASIDELNVTIEEQRKLINYLTLYHGSLAIKKFKQLKMEQYYRVMYLISVKEIQNSHVSATLFQQILHLNTQAVVREE